MLKTAIFLGVGVLEVVVFESIPDDKESSHVRNGCKLLINFLAPAIPSATCPRYVFATS